MLAAELLVQVLKAQDVKNVFGVPGETYVSVLEHMGKRKGIEFINVSSEVTASHAAGAFSKIVGDQGAVGVVMTTRGPGTDMALTGLDYAQKTSTPIVHLAFHAPTDLAGFDQAWQNLKFEDLKGNFVKEVLTAKKVDDNNKEDIGATIVKAFEIARSGRPGPVMVVIPTDILAQNIDEPKKIEKAKTYNAEPNTDSLRDAASILNSAKKPIIVVGDVAILGKGNKEIIGHLADITGSLIMNNFANPHYMINHKNFGGNLGYMKIDHVEEAIKQADAILYAGSSLSEHEAGRYRDLMKDKKTIQLFPDILTKQFFNPDVVVTGDVAKSLDILAAKTYGVEKSQREWVEGFNRKETEWLKRNFEASGKMNLSTALREMVDMLPKDAVIATGDGAFCTYMTVLDYKDGHQVIGPQGPMGAGLGRGFGGKAAVKDQPVVVIMGDGETDMNPIGAITKSIEHKMPLKIIIVDNGGNMAIAGHQVRRKNDGATGIKPGYGTINKNTIDYKLLGDAAGAKYTAMVDKTSDFAASFAKALEEAGTTVIHLKYDRRDVAPGNILRF